MGYIAAAIGLFIFIFTFFNFNAPPPDNQPQDIQPMAETSKFCESVPEISAPTFRAPANNATKTGSEDDETLGTPVINSDCTGRGIRYQMSENPVTYRLIRKNVPMSKTDVKKNGENFNDEGCHFVSADKADVDIPEVDSKRFKVFYPQISGEISLDREIRSRTRGRDSNYLYLIDYGLVFLLHLDENGKFIELKGGTTQGDAETFYLADVYQDVESPGRGELPPEALACDTTQGAALVGGTRVIQPQQATSSARDQLQLEYFVFGTGATAGEVVNGWGIHCKPAVYLYPPKKQLVNVKVHPSGFLTYVDPPYNKETGWTVWAEPNGRLQLINDERLMINDYLYFESKIRDEVIEKPEKGWVVKYEELENLYLDILPKLGLNEKQKNDFIEYWNKTLPASPYYFVGIIDQDNVNEIEKLEITPKPDSINRVRVYFERLDGFKVVQAPNIPAIDEKRSTNNEFRVVEWGGMVKNDPNHPFTCSQ